MAVTIHQAPDRFTPSDNPVVWTFSSNQTAQPNFVYLVQVFINDTAVANEFVFPDNGIYARFDASNYTSNSCQMPTISTALLADANNYCKVRITVTERYGAIPTNQASTAASNIVTWKARMFDDDFVAWDSANYVYGATGAWLNNLPEPPKVRVSDESIRLLFINDETSITAFKVELFEADGTSIVSDTINFTATAYQLVICNLTPSVIVASALGITSGNFTDCAYYEVSANALAGLPVQRINIDNAHFYPTYKRLHCLSQWGGIDAISFGLLSKKSGTIKSFGYRRTFGSWSGSSFVFNNTDGRDIDYAKTIDREMRCVSDWLSEELQNWMIYNLIGAVAIWEEDFTDGTLIRRSVMSRTIEEFTRANDVIFLEEITIQLPTYNSMVL